MKKVQARTIRVLAAVASVTLVAGAFIASYSAPGDAPVEKVEHPSVPRSEAFEQAFSGGVDHLRQGRLDAALTALQLAARLGPDVPEGHTNLGFAWLEAKRPGDAQASFERALAINAAQTNAYYGLAESLEMQGDLAAALGAMKTFVHLSEADAPFTRRAQSAIWEWQAQRDGEASLMAAGQSDVKETKSALLTEQLESIDALIERHRGQVVVVNVWATWCAPCRSELASLDALDQFLDDDKAVVIGVSIDEDIDFAREFIRGIGLQFANVIDPHAERLKQKFDIVSYPTTLIFDAEGKLDTTVRTARDWDDEESRSMISGLIASRTEYQKEHKDDG